MIEGKLAIEAGIAGVNLLDTILKLIKQAKSEGKRLNVADLLQRIPAEAFEMAGALQNAVEKLKQDFLDAKLDLNKTIAEHQQDKYWWLSKRWRLVQRFQTQVSGLVTASGHFLNDFVAVANCREAEDLIAASFKDAANVHEQLEAETNMNLPIGKIFDSLIAHARRVRSELGDMLQGPKQA